MSIRPLAAISGCLTVVLLAIGCAHAGDTLVGPATGTAVDTAPRAPAGSVPAPVPEPAAAAAIPLCDDVPFPAAPASWYRPTPVYVENEMPIMEVRAWAETQPGFADAWIDRGHNGWITVAFTGPVEELQAALESRFPSVGVVAVHVEHTQEELAALQQRVTIALQPHGWGFAVGSGNAKNIVSVDLGVRSDERLAALAEFAGEPLCVNGKDASLAVPDGDQIERGEGWRLLGEDEIGVPYRTGAATDPTQYADLWSTSGLKTDAPDVDFQTEIVVWFGAVEGSSCPIRMDGVVIDRQAAVVHGTFVVPGNPAACTADARPHSYVVAIERSALPAGPFAIQLRATDPPRGVPEERTLVDADLSQPGAVATADQIRFDPTLFAAAGQPVPGG
jgi:hypothetical protein